MTGKFIVIEGLNATGKSTLVAKLAKSLNATLLQCPPRADIARRETVLGIYRSFDPVEIDTSCLKPSEVLEVVLATLRRSGLC